LDFDMQNRMAPIDQVHSRAICDEVADRLRIFLSKDLSDTPVSLKSQILRLKELDQSPSIVPGCGMEYRGKQYTIIQGIGPHSWKWALHWDEKTVKSGQATSRDAAMDSVVWLIEGRLRRRRPPIGSRFT
jgi:hypothetical protein